MNIKHEIKVGAFIIASIFMLVYIILWLHKFDLSSYQKISARFEDVGTLNIGSSVLYRGVKAGTVYDISISEDEMYAIVSINITNKNIVVYEDSTASVISKGVTGTKVLTIEPPETIIGKKALKSGAIINGRRPFTLESIQKALTNLPEDITVEDFILELYYLVKNTKKLTAKLDTLTEKTEKMFSKEHAQRLDKFFNSTTILAKNLNITSQRLNRILDDEKTTRDIKASIASTNEAMQKFSNVADKTDTLVDKSTAAIENLDNTVTKMDNTINNPQLHGSIRESMEKMSSLLSDLRNITGDPETQNNLKSAIKESKESISRINCVSKELSYTLSKKFLIPRMLIGNPGKNMTKCTPEMLFSEKTINEKTQKNE